MGRKRWLLRSCLFTLAAFPLSGALFYGCDSPTQFDNLCGWLADPDNCYREFFIDVGTSCGSTGSRVGSFASRAKLDQCFLLEGGIVTFEPPIDPAVPITDMKEGPLAFKFTNPDGSDCGEVQFTSKYSFSVDIKGEPLPEDGTIPESLILGGKFSMTDNEDIVDVACPQGGGFKFDRLQVTRCREFEGILPHAEIDFNPGGIDQPGLVRLRVYYPPPEGELAGAAPVPVLYFDCAIPAAPPLCLNGMQDGSETDVDCGGGFCEKRCEDGQKCASSDDCLSNNCGIVMGLKTCLGP